MKKLKTMISKILLILITISLVVFSMIPENMSVYGTEVEDEQEENSEVSDTKAIQEQIVDYAKKWIGVTKYVWGGTSLTNGADCSGLVMAVYAEFGYNLPTNGKKEYNYSRAESFSRIGIPVSYDSVELGDIIIINWGKTSGWSWHCGIYAGNGQYVNCSSSKGHAILSNVPTNNIHAISRIVGSIGSDGRIPTFVPNGGGQTGGIIEGFKPQGEIDDTDDNPIDLDSLEFDFGGNPTKMEFNGETKKSVWLFSKFSQFVDYIIGIMVQGVKGAIVGWTAIVEGMVNNILNLLNNEI